MDLCRNMLDRKGVLATKSHRGKYENMWNQIDNNFERKKILKIFWDFWGQKFRNYVILYAQKWICVVVCSIKNVFWRLKVIGENKKTCENNLATILSKKNFEIFLRFLRSEISKVRHFICPKNVFSPTSRWWKKVSRGAMKTNKNSCDVTPGT